MLAGRIMPCQWIEVSSSSALATRIVTVSPSRQRTSGAGMVPFTVMPMRVAPVKLTGDSPMRRSNSVPVSVAWGCVRVEATL